jgi:phage terminase Nu1 subunit (DNA packaging protein)
MATAAQAAKHIFISPSRFRDLVSAGTITHQPSGRYVLDVVREEYILNAQRVMAGRGTDGGAALAAQRAKLAEAQTAAALIKNSISTGDFVSLAVVKSALVSTFAMMREQMLTLPGTVADSLTPFSPKDRAEITEIIRDKVHELLEGLSETKIRFGPTRGKRPDRDADDARIATGA